MENIIRLGNIDIKFRLRVTSRARRIRLTIEPTGELVVTQPRKISFTLVAAFMKEKAAWIIAKQKKIAEHPPLLGQALSPGDYYRKRAAARQLIQERLDYFNQFYNFSYRAFSVRNQKTRWGSCSKAANLNFNYRLLDLPAPWRDYIIVHELCHLKEFNHSPRFWALVARTVPNHQRLRKALKSGELV